ncbi:MAG: hypothetical protein VR70_07950 [Rhodospirillaceae bacterium BRH_c57]|nr:MAG: hypothetical protein VR70_07950 [Rhodospirillaceae bacterium BRH_c57]
MRSTPTATRLKLVPPAIAKNDIVAMARRSRESAKAFSATVARFGTEMPECMDRFHDAMKAFRTVAAQLNGTSPIRVEPTPLEAVRMPRAA